MRVLYSFAHPIGGPGIGTTAMQQVLGLLGRGHDVTVIATSLHKNGSPVPKLYATMSIAGVRIPHKLLGMDNSRSYHDLMVANHLLRRPGAYDIVHCWPHATLHTAKAAARVGIPSVREVPNTHAENAYVVVEALCAELGITQAKGSSHRRHPGRLERELKDYETAFRLLVPSQAVAETFLARGYPDGKLLRHRYGFDAGVFKPRATRADGPFHAVFLGSVGARKGAHVALEAWRRSRASQTGRFSIYGRVEPGYESVLAPFADTPGVEFHEFTRDANSVLQASDVLLLPSFEEGSALVTYEAQGCGAVPLVSSAAGAVCTPGVTGMVSAPGDAAALAGHLDLLSSDPERLAAMRAAVLAGRDDLSWAAAAKRLEECYEQARAEMRMTSAARAN